MSDVRTLLARLTEADGAPGYEDSVRNLLKKHVSPYVDELKVDALGNLVCVKGSGRPRVMLAAHMDEVAMMVRHVEDNGFIRIVRVGGLSPDILPGNEVRIRGSNGPVYGVIGTVPPHIRKQVKARGEGRQVRFEDLYVDVGAESRRAVEELGVRVGDFVFFTTCFRSLPNDYVMGKAFDDRMGCAVIASTLKELDGFRGTLYAVFTVQEEVGLRGATVAAYNIAPDVAIVLEGTLAGDTPGIPPQEAVTRIGKGPALRVMDASMIANRRFLKFIEEVASRAGIPYQLQISPGSGTDAGRIHVSRSGVPSAVISVPCRYIHSPRCLASLKDFSSTVKLLTEVLNSVHEFKYG